MTRTYTSFSFWQKVWLINSIISPFRNAQTHKLWCTSPASLFKIPCYLVLIVSFPHLIIGCWMYFSFPFLLNHSLKCWIQNVYLSGFWYYMLWMQTILKWKLANYKHSEKCSYSLFSHKLSKIFSSKTKSNEAHSLFHYPLSS